MRDLYLISIFVGLILSSCGGESGENNQEQSGGETQDSSSVQEKALKYPKFERIVVIGERMIETLYAFGDSSKIVASDRSYAAFPNLKVPSVGYKDALQASYLLKQKPEAVFAEEESLNTEVKEALQKANIPFFTYPPNMNLQEAKEFTRDFAQKLNKKSRGEALVRKMDKAKKEIDQILQKKRKDTLKVLYVHGRGTQALMYMGEFTPVQGLIELAGAKNPAQFEEATNRLGEEDMYYLNPHFILMSQKSVDSFKGKMYEAVALTNATAYRVGRLIILGENALTNPGVNFAQTALDICKKVYEPQYYSPLPVAPPEEEEVPVDSRPTDEIEIINDN